MELKRCWTTKFNLAFNSKNKFIMRVLGMANPEGLALALPAGTASIIEPADMLLTIEGAPDVGLGRLGRVVMVKGGR